MLALNLSAHLITLMSINPIHFHRKMSCVNGLIDIRVIKWAFKFDASI